MGRFCQRIVLSAYRSIVSLLSPSLSGGLLNFVVEPVDLAQSHEKALRIVEFNTSKLPEYVKDLVLKSKLPTTILSTVNPTNSTQGLKRTGYREMIFASAVALVLAIIAFLVSVYYPFFRFRKIEKKLLRKKSKGKYKPTRPRRSHIPSFFKRWYIAFGITGLVMMVFLALGIAGLAASTDSVEFALRPAVANPNLGDTSILSTIDMIPGEVDLFFDEFVGSVKTKMDDVLGKAVITKLLTTVKKNMMKESGLQELIDLKQSLKKTLSQLKKDSSNVHDRMKELKNSVELFIKNQSFYVDQLKLGLRFLCTYTKEPQCNETRADQLNIQSNAVTELQNPLLLLNNLINMLKDDLMNSFDKLDNLTKKLDQILQKIGDEFQFRGLISLKDFLTSAYSYKDEVNSQLRKAQTVFKAAMPSLHLFFTIFGYSIVLSLLILLALSLVQYIFCVKQGRIMITSDPPSAEPTTRHPPFKSISTIITVISMYAPTVLLLSAAFSIATTLIANEGCRYIDDDDALSITDMAVNLAIKYRWADFRKTKLPNLDIGQPEFVLRYLIKDCGILLDLRGAVDRSARKSIEEGGNTTIKEITNMNIGQYLPTGLDDLSKRMKDVLDYKPRGLIKEIQTLETNKTQMVAILVDIMMYAVVRAQFPAAYTVAIIVKQWRKDILRSRNFGQMATEAFNGFVPMKEKYKLIKKSKELLDNVKSVFGSEQRVRKVVKSSIEEIENDIRTISEPFSEDIIPCHRLQKITNAAIDALCRDQGILTALGAYFFLLEVVMFHLIFTILLTRIYFSAHGFLHLWLLL